MVHVLSVDDPPLEKRRLLAQAKHCRELARALADQESGQEFASLARSYEVKASMVMNPENSPRTRNAK